MHPKTPSPLNTDLAEIDGHLDQKFIDDQRQKVPDMQARVNLELNAERGLGDAKVLAAQAQAARQLKVTANGWVDQRPHEGRSWN